MTYQKDTTGILQSATKAAAELTAAELNASVIKSHDSVVTRFEELRDLIFAPLKEAVDADNAMFKAEEESSPAKPAKSYSKSSGGGAKAKNDGPIDNPGSVTIGRKGGNGKFDGCTVAQVHAMTGAEAEDYGYVDKQGVGKPGSLYIDWMAGNEKNPFMQKVATQFLQELRASSDAA